MFDPTSSRPSSPLPRLGALTLTAALLAACGDSGATATPSGDVLETVQVKNTFATAGAPAALRPALTFTTTPARPNLPGLPDDDPILGQPLVVNGDTTGHDVVRRQVCAGPVGQVQLEIGKLRLFMDAEIDRQKKAGVPVDKFTVTEEEMAQIRVETEARIKEEFPGGEVELSDVIPDEKALSRVKVTKLFQKVFLPENPENYPPVTIEALRTQENGEQILEQLQRSYEEREPGAKKQAGQMMFDQVILQQVMAFMFESAEVVEDLDKLPVNVLLRINGRDITVDQVWSEIKGNVSPSDVRAAKQWIVNMRLLEQALKKEGVWLSDAEAKKAYDDHSDPYKDSIFSMERIATSIKKFPSIRAYREYHRVFESLKKLIAKDLADMDMLQAFAKDRTNLVVGQVTVDADIILLSAFDFEKGKWREDGWAGAEAETDKVMRLLLEEGRDWGQVLEEHSDFYDPPVSMTQRANPEELARQAMNKGRFRNKQRNHLLGHLEESEYSIFLNGTSITEKIFFDMEVGETSQPLKGPRGWYVARLLRRSTPPARMTNDMETYRALLEQDYATNRLNAYAQELVKKAEVYGL